MNETIEIASAQATAADMMLAKNVGDTLWKEYPNHLWAVEVKKGVIVVKNLNLSGNWGFLIKIGTIFSATDLDKQVRKAGGEVLERFRLSRARMSEERVFDKVLALPTDFAGRTHFDK